MQSFPKPLTAKEEKECLARCRSGDEEARNLLIEKNLRLVAYIARKYNVGDKDMDDLISIGTIGLIKGIDTFDETKNIRLATYAARCIDKAMQISDDMYWISDMAEEEVHAGILDLSKLRKRGKL